MPNKMVSVESMVPLDVLDQNRELLKLYVMGDSAMKSRAPALIVIGIALLSGCALTAPSSASSSEVAPIDLALQTRVAWLPTCPHPADEKGKIGFLGLIATAIAPKLIEGAVDSAAAALKAAGQAKTTASTASNLSNFYGVTQDADLKVLNPCLVVVRGKFSSAGAGSTPTWADNDQLRGLSSVQFMLEAKVQPLRGNKYFQLAPQYLEVAGFEDRSLADRKDRDYTVAIAMSVPGGAQPFGSAELTFKDIAVGVIKDPNDWRLRGATSMPIAFPPESADATKAKTKRETQLAPYLLAIDVLSPEDVPPPAAAPSLYAPTEVASAADALCQVVNDFNRTTPKQFQVSDDRCAYKLDTKGAVLDAELKKANKSPARQDWAGKICRTPVKDGDGKIVGCRELSDDPKLDTAKFTYFTTQLTLSETREGSKFAAFLGTALGAAKDDVATVLKDRLIPKTQAQKDAEAADRAAVVLSDLQVTKAEEDLAAALFEKDAKAADIIAARIALLKTKIECNKAYRKANLPSKYPEFG